MSDLAAIREKVIDTIRKAEPKLASVRMTDSTSLTDLNMDSLRLIELGVLVEDEFGHGVRFDDWIEQERSRGEHAYSLESLTAFVSKATCS